MGFGRLDAGRAADGSLIPVLPAARGEAPSLTEKLLFPQRARSGPNMGELRWKSLRAEGLAGAESSAPSAIRGRLRLRSPTCWRRSGTRSSGCWTRRSASSSAAAHSEPGQGLDDEQRQQILALASNFPGLWNDPATPHRERKRMARLLIEDVTLAKVQGHAKPGGASVRRRHAPAHLGTGATRLRGLQDQRRGRQAVGRPHRWRDRRYPQPARIPKRIRPRVQCDVGQGGPDPRRGSPRGRYRLRVRPLSRDRDCVLYADENRSIRDTALLRRSRPSSMRSRCSP